MFRLIDIGKILNLLPIRWGVLFKELSVGGIDYAQGDIALIRGQAINNCSNSVEPVLA